MVDGKTTWSISPLYLHPRPPLTSPGATEEFTVQFKCVGNSIKRIGRQPIVGKTSILGAPIIIEQSHQFYVIGVVRLTREGKPCPCYFNENIRDMLFSKQEKVKVPAGIKGTVKQAQGAAVWSLVRIPSQGITGGKQEK
ncbi:uncharacterized protein LOC122955030 [Acropora millepora]|uniref:uncharacterized protein LOC122955030 n=1 Tax=Acropora millepora TaxID=45264 RepID=UPI001CF490CD|nr:uncharacterized protein LOC122955030 [Acropora millepora]